MWKTREGNETNERMYRLDAEGAACFDCLGTFETEEWFLDAFIQFRHNRYNYQNNRFLHPPQGGGEGRYSEEYDFGGLEARHYKTVDVSGPSVLPAFPLMGEFTVPAWDCPESGSDLCHRSVRVREYVNCSALGAGVMSDGVALTNPGSPVADLPTDEHGMCWREAVEKTLYKLRTDSGGTANPYLGSFLATLWATDPFDGWEYSQFAGANILFNLARTDSDWLPRSAVMGRFTDAKWACNKASAFCRRKMKYKELRGTWAARQHTNPKSLTGGTCEGRHGVCQYPTFESYAASDGFAPFPFAEGHTTL